MKLTSTLALAAVLVISSLQAFSQPFTGKPSYKIEAKRAGTHIGDIHIELFPLIAPLHVANFDSLVEENFYDSTAFHRVIPGFMIQGGDPNSRSGPVSTWGFGQPGQPTVNAEFSKLSHVRGILSAARSNDINSATSQFFIVVAPSLHLDNNYSAYGRVVSGMNVVDDIVNSPRNSNDRPLQKIEMFITRTGSNDSVPAAPNLISPASGFAGGQPDQELTWAPVSDAALYQLQVSSDPNFAPLLFEEDIKQTATSFELSSLQPQTQYYWRMRTNNGGHLSPWSSSSFSTGLPATTLVAPANYYTTAAPDINLEWQPLTGASSYRVQVATNPFFLPNAIVLDSGGITNTSLLTNNLPPHNNFFFWRVAAQQNGADGFWTDYWRFKITTTGIEDYTSNAFALQIKPNPAYDKITVTYKLKAKSEVAISVFDMNSRLVKSVSKIGQPAGKQEVSIETTDLAPGMYVLQLTGNDLIVTKKLVVAK